MIEIGRKQTLTVVNQVSFGVYLGEKPGAGQKETVLLPAKQVPEGTGIGDRLTVFVYLDSSDRPIATVREPMLTLGEVAVLKVKQVTRIGAFLDWGLEKDLLLPYHEQTTRVKEGQDCLAALYLDKSGRLCASMKVYHYLSSASPYGIGDQVQGRVYEISDNFGVFVAVDDKYTALIPHREAQGTYTVGEILSLRVTEVKEDGKLTVSPRQKAYLQMDADAVMIRKALEDRGGELPFDDKAAPEVIAKEFGLSKNAFKRAVGRLYKAGEIELDNGRIRLAHPEESAAAKHSHS
ncbi:MAG: RNA-binding protein [Blautia sp.]|nr:RNA-binding protein [Blautia sp.]